MDPLLKRGFVRAGILNMVPAGLVDRFQVNLPDFSRYPPILVYQVGKVGSRAIYMALKRAKLRNPVYHVHFLSPPGIEAEETRYRMAGLLDTPRAKHLRISKLLRKRMDSGEQVKWLVISAVREPISRMISEFFQIASRDTPELLDDRGQIRQDLALQEINRRLAAYDEKTDPGCVWLDQELLGVFGIDIFQEPFDKENGYAIVEREDVRVLIFTQENLRRSFHRAIDEFLRFDRPLELKDLNVTSVKRRVDRDELDKGIVVTSETCERVYTSQFVRHFYSEEAIQGFMRKWASTGSGTIRSSSARRA